VHDTLVGLLNVFCCLVAFCLTCCCLSRERYHRELCACIVAFGGIVAIVGITQYALNAEKIYGIIETTSPVFFGPYTNRSHFAGFIELTLPFALSVTLMPVASAKARLLAGFVSFTMATAVFLSASRAGMIGVVIATIIVAAYSVRSTSKKFAVPLLSTSMLIGAMLLGLQSTGLSRLQSMSRGTLIDRFATTRDTFNMVSQHPVFGTGLGTFPTVYPKYRSYVTDVFINQAHNDVAQLAVETGIIGFSIVLLFLTICAKRGHQKAATGNPWQRLAAIAALASFYAILLHSLVDFNLQIPANGLWFTAVCGIMAAPRLKRGMKAISL
jgi:O-antigen ligase